MNENTLVSVHGYAGDLHQIRWLLPYYLHHQCPVAICAPEDSPITSSILSPRKEIRYINAGKRAYIGQLSLDRQAIHLQKLLEAGPYQWFLMNDSDSVCLSPRLPDYLFADPSIVWSNVVSDEMHPRAATYPFPRLAFQPPYFMSRSCVEKLVEVAPRVPADVDGIEARTPFIDWCMMAWSIRAGLGYRSFPDGISVPTNEDNRASCDCMDNEVQHNGKIFLHSVKRREMILRVAYSRLRYKKSHNIK